MKYCKECGRKLKSSAEFCYACGAPCEIEDDALYMERKAAWRRMSAPDAKAERRGMIADVWAVIICALLAIVVLFIYIMPARRAYTEALNGESEAAESLFVSSVQGSSFESFVMRLLVPRGASAIVSAYTDGNVTYDDAVSRLDQLAEFESPLNNAEKAKERIERLRTSTEAWTEAQAYEAAGDYRSALISYRLVDENSAHYDEAVAKASEMEGLYKSEVITEVGTPSTDAEYEAAVNLLNDALTLLPDDKTLSDKLTSIQQTFASGLKARAMTEANQYISQGYYKQAIDVLNNALEYNSSDRDLTQLLNTATKDYETWVQSQVSIYLGNDDRAGALALLERVRKDLPDDQIFQQLYESVSRNS